jgi:transcriptional regulator with PAS, ATPase and Fis domain
MNHFIRMYSKQVGGNATQVSSSLMRLLESYHWPGNVRELENMAKRYVVLGEEEHMLSAMKQPEEPFSSAPDVIGLTPPASPDKTCNSTFREKNHSWCP